MRPEHARHARDAPRARAPAVARRVPSSRQSGGFTVSALNGTKCFREACAVRFRRGRSDPALSSRTSVARDRGEMTVENPARRTPCGHGEARVLSCPLCNDTARFPVTVVSAHWTIPGDAPPIRPPRARDRVPTFHHPPDPVPLSSRVSQMECPYVLPRAYRQGCSPGKRPTRAPSATSPCGTTFVEKKIVWTEPRRPSWTSCARGVRRRRRRRGC